MSRGEHYAGDSAKDVMEAYKRVQERLSWDFTKWRQELLSLSIEVELS